MKLFSRLIEKIRDQSNEEIQIEYIITYLSKLDESDLKWAIFLLRGGRLSRTFSTAQLIEFVKGHVEFDALIMEKCLDMSKNTLETVGLVIPLNKKNKNKSLSYWMEFNKSIRSKTEQDKYDSILKAWSVQSIAERHVFNKLLTNTWRSPISSHTLRQSLATHFAISHHQLALNLFRNPINAIASIEALATDTMNSQHYPIDFVKPTQVDTLEALGSASDYASELDWNGVRVQLVIAGNEMHVWTMRGEIVTGLVPELISFEANFPAGTIIDGLILAKQEHKILPKKAVRNRLKRKNITKKIIANEPIVFCAIDLLKFKGNLLLDISLDKRRKLLEKIISNIPTNIIIQFSDVISLSSWEHLATKWDEIKMLNSTSVIVKNKLSFYNQQTTWYRLTSPPKVIQAILLYVRRGDGAQANQFIEYTLGARAGGTFMPITKVNARFIDEENLAMKKFIKDNTLERFGPVLSLNAELIFEISYEAIQESKRHKCGFTLKRPTFIKWESEAQFSEVIEIESLLQQIPE